MFLQLVITSWVQFRSQLKHVNYVVQPIFKWQDTMFNQSIRVHTFTCLTFIPNPRCPGVFFNKDLTLGAALCLYSLSRKHCICKFCLHVAQHVFSLNLICSKTTFKTKCLYLFTSARGRDGCSVLHFH